MNKDIDQLHIDLLYEKDTNEHNGVEVKIPLKLSSTNVVNSVIDSLTKALYGISPIKSVYVDDKRTYKNDTLNYIINIFNDRKLYEYDNFKINTLGGRSRYFDSGNVYVLVGLIPYKIDNISSFIPSGWKDTFIEGIVTPVVEVGSVDITPNRESLLYSEKTKKRIQEAFNKTIEELTQLWNTQNAKEIEDFHDYIEEKRNKYSNYLTIKDNFTIRLNRDLPKVLKHKDFEKFDNDTLDNVIHYFYYHEIPLIGQGKRTTQVRFLLSALHSKDTVLVVPNAQGFSSKYIKGFIKQEYGENITIIGNIHITPYRVKYLFKDVFGMSLLSNPEAKAIMWALFKELLHYVKERAIIKDIIKSEEYIQYKKDNTEQTFRDTTRRQFVIYHTDNYSYNGGFCSYNYTTTIDNLGYYLRDTFSKEHTITYADVDDPIIEIFSQINYPKLVILGLSKILSSKINHIKAVLPNINIMFKSYKCFFQITYISKNSLWEHTKLFSI